MSPGRFSNVRVVQCHARLSQTKNGERMLDHMGASVRLFYTRSFPPLFLTILARRLHKLLALFTILFATGSYCQTDLDRLVQEFKGDLDAYHLESDTLCAWIRDPAHCDTTELKSCLWIFQLHFAVPDTERTGMTEQEMRSLLTFERTYYRQVLVKRWFSRRVVDTIAYKERYILGAFGLAQNDMPCVYADFMGDTPHMYSSRYSAALARRYTVHHDKLVFMPRCNNGLNHAKWYGCITSTDSLRWFEYGVPDITYSTEEMTAKGWDKLIIRWAYPDE